MTHAEEYSHDFLQPFLIDHSKIRGQFVRLGEVVNTILGRHDYPESVLHVLAELLVVGGMLAGNMKSQGILTIQAKGEGPLSLIVVDCTSSGDMRGCAEFAEGGREAIVKHKKKKLPLNELMGKGYLAITLDLGEQFDRYQGIVELGSTNVKDSILHYFTQSQQVEMSIVLAVSKKKRRWSAGGIMIERLPLEGGVAESEDEQEAEKSAEEHWQETRMFMESVKAEELLDIGLPPQALLYRLFNEEGVWAYRAKKVQVACRCSRERIEGVLRSLEEAELQDLMEEGKLAVKCQFCAEEQAFTAEELHAIFKQ